MKIEFYIYENELWYMTSDGETDKLTESNRDIISSILNTIQDSYPEAYKALTSCYKSSSLNVPYFQYLVVRRFCKCNFGNLDSTKHDINDSKFNFERVGCPLRGECQFEGRICNPKFNSELSKSELRVMKLYYEGEEIDEIAESLCLSPNTVKNHIKSSYAKLGVHEKAEFYRYAVQHSLFKE